ncbi:Kif11 [Symbiodinium natans]|uniref:Kif11 protein n=1 Tax=Symbiodinium natans TaxID=878477 RepID=A0A812QF75_9DINO|nr:Kif11 [Symbiodinium natans]
MAGEPQGALELPLWFGGSQAASRGSAAAAGRRSQRRRSTLAVELEELDKELQTDARQIAELKMLKALALVLYTLGRIAANLGALGLSSRRRTFSAVLRPIVTGLGVAVFLYREDRFSTKSQLHIWSRRTVLLLAVFFYDESMTGFRKSWPVFSILPWEIICNVLQVHMTNLKLQALGWRLMAMFCHMLAAAGCGSLLMALVMISFKIPFGDFGNGTRTIGAADIGYPAFSLLLFSFFCCWTTLFSQCGALCHAATGAIVAAHGDEALRSTACFLYLNALLVILGPVLGFCGTLFFVAGKEGRMTWMTLDVVVQIFTALALSGMMGPRNPMEAFRKLADLSGYGFECSKRIAFPGHINEQAAKCIVSFPGVYNALWDKAVKHVRADSVSEDDACSLACVFLTDVDSGLGQHSINPDTPGKCWCHSIYGHVRASAYLRVVEVEPSQSDSSETRMMLAHEKADAHAMGQLVLIKNEQSDFEWQKELADALRRARELCELNDGRAPWGCQWFEVWKRNVDQAVDLKQELHVFYFQGRRGQGKLSWDQLCDAAAQKKARRDSGLGASQTAEVAYLMKMGIMFREHDVQDFLSFLAGG